MLNVLTVPIDEVKDGPYRNTMSPFKSDRWRSFDNLFAKLISRAKAGHTLPVHVARLSDCYLVLDGHICADVYRYIRSTTLAVILHEEITTAVGALEAYVAFNYLRADWRDSVTLMPILSNLANLNGLDSAVSLMNNSESAEDLIRLRTVRWWEFNSGEKASIPSMPMLDDLLEDLTTNDKKVRGTPRMASMVIHAAEAHQKPPRRRKAKENQAEASVDDREIL